MKKIIGSTIVMFLLAGCATTPATNNSVREVSPERIFKKDYFVKTDKRNASLTITRDGGMWGGACNHLVTINNIKVFSLRPNESATIYLEPKEYGVRVELAASSFCPYAQTADNIELEAGSNVRYRIASSMSVNNSLELIRVQ